MGNCQAIDAETLVIQYPCGRVDKLYWPVTASEIMRMNPGHRVALLITSTTTNNNNIAKNENSSTRKSYNEGMESNRNTVQIMRVKLLRPTDNLALGNVYRIISTKEVMKSVLAKKQVMLRKDGVKLGGAEMADKDAERLPRSSPLDRDNPGAKLERHHQSRTTMNSGTIRPKTWQPSLLSISEAGS